MSRPLSVLVVDNSAVLRTLVSEYLSGESDLQVIWSVPDAESALECVARTCPDVIVLDQHLPAASGLAVLPDLRRHCPRARIVMFSSEDEVRGYALDEGADEFVSKLSSFSELAAALRER